MARPVFDRRAAGVALLAALGFLGGCVDWQESYNHAARQECLQEINTDARRDCLTRTEDAAAERRARERAGD